MGLVSMVMVMVMVMIVIMIVIMMLRTAVRGFCEFATKVRRDYQVQRRLRYPSGHLDTFLGQDVDCALANPAHNNDLDSLCAQPTRKEAWLVGRCVQQGRAQSQPLWLIDFHDGKLSGTSEMAVQPAVNNRNSNFHILLNDFSLRRWPFPVAGDRIPERFPLQPGIWKAGSAN